MAKRKNRQFTEEEKATFALWQELGYEQGRKVGYREGWQDAQAHADDRAQLQIQNRINLFQTANHHLWILLCQLSELEPLTCVQLNTEETKKLIVILTKSHSKENLRWVKALGELLKKAQAEQKKLTKHLTGKSGIVERYNKKREKRGKALGGNRTRPDTKGAISELA